jgi:hypothetical protein
MKIPYGLSNFGELRTNGYFYVDKTHFLPELENLGPRYLLFLRPRRMGKSLFVSLLEHYYDLGRADQFDALFGGLWIHINPTPERNRYLVLSLDFSQVTTDGGVDALRRSFFAPVQLAIVNLVRSFRDRIPALAELDDELAQYQEPEILLGALMGAVRRAGHKLYVLIDEYDHFANRVLAADEQELYTSTVQRADFVRTFYATLKAGTASGAVSRMFITGVLPLMLDDMASGFNIAAHISQDRALNALAGFTHADVEQAVDALIAAQPELASLPEFASRSQLLAVLEQYYDGYRFAPGSSARVFNSDMVLYFLQQVARERAYPVAMLDFNVRTDYRNLQRIGMLTGAARDERRSLLESILGEGSIRTSLVSQFGVTGLSSQASFLSLLYYMGMLTLAQQPPDISVGAVGYRLEIPNRVIRELQWEHLARLFKEEGKLTIDTRDIEAALESMAFQGDIEPFLTLFHERVIKAMGLKDLRRFDEKSLKLMLLAFISLSRLFHPLSEREFAQGYCDLFLGVSPLHPAAKFAWLLELKYLPASAKAAQLEGAFAQAAEQVARYAQDERLVPLLTQGQALKAGVLVFAFARKALFRPWPSDTPSTPAMAHPKTPKAATKAPARASRKPAAVTAPRKRTPGRSR